MDKKPPPLLGFNNNVRHRGRIFHIQTEDSGIKHARIVTHLFADGGRIVNSTRTDYAEHLGRPDMHEVLRRVMREQHKAMFIRLRAGELDSLIESACGPRPTEGAEAEPSDVGPRVAVPVAPPPLPAPAAALPEPPAPPAQPPAALPPPPKRRRLSNPNLQPAPPSIPPPAGEIELDDAILSGSERRSPPRRSQPAAASAPEPQPEPEQPAKAPAEKATEEEARYAPPRPPNIFEAPLTEHSIFGERLIREKSLDEVILSYLAEDLEGGTNE